MSTTRHGSAVAKGIVRKTVVLPPEVFDFAEEQSNEPQHAGNLSSYVRSLILKDREQKEQKP